MKKIKDEHILKQQEIEDTIISLLEKKDVGSLKEYLCVQYPADIAEVMNGLDSEDNTFIMNCLDPEIASEVILEIDEITEDEMLKNLDNLILTDILEYMNSDDAADIIQEFSEDHQKKLLQMISDRKSREDITKLLKYDEDSAGGIMTTEFISVTSDMTVKEVIMSIKLNAIDAETIYYIYVVDNRGVCLGVVSIRELIIADNSQKIEELLIKDIIFVRPDADQEIVASLVKKYNLMAIPVIDNNGILLGIVTSDDIMDVLEEEATEDMFVMAGTDYDEVELDSVIKIASVRVPWLITNLLGGILAGSIINLFKVTLSDAISLAIFVPVITGMGGNAGLQSSTIVVRGLATGGIDTTDIWEILYREARIGALIGLLCGITVGVIGKFWLENSGIGIVVGISMFACILTATFVGSVVPIFFKRVGVDPAIAAGPFVTTSNDISGLIIYFGLATLMIKYII